MEKYRKPIIAAADSMRGVFPLAGIVGLSAAKLLVVGAAAGLGLGAASRGNNIIDSNHMQSLTFRRDFALN